MELQKTLENVKSMECFIEVFGLGYVGFPLSIRLASSGFKVIGIDTDQKKIEQLKNNSLLGSQPSLRTAFLESAQNGNFIPSQYSTKSDKPRIGIISVPTPISDKNNDSNVFVYSAVENFLDCSKAGDAIILESSVKVGTTDEIKEKIESTGYKVGENFGLCFCPERIDPLNQKWKLENIPRIIFASDDTTFQIAQELYKHVNNSNLIRVSSSKIAEVVKSFENAFRLVNISLVNELAVLCDKLQINVKEVIDAASTKPFGFMPFYPGAGAGGHCIPKDPRFLLESAKKMGVKYHTIENALIVNSLIPKYICDSIEKTLSELKLEKSAVVCGLAYKADIEDMRDSPGFKILDEFHQKKFRIASYDPYFRSELLDRYMVENHIEKLDFKILSDLDNESINEYSCICIVQHHTKTKFRINEIYKNSLVPMIYDCQNEITFDSNSKTVLRRLGH
ncbi:MAG TPA: nucleotide sugar dehydrogenase [Nitrosopumilaceae archaeon]|nr:nucleotide sugar dehydrogenase [Nitrosopumilaceae archaeon]